MNKQSVIIDYSKLPDSELDNFAQGVHNSLSGNANFTWAATVLPALLTNIVSYRTKLEIAANGTAKDVTSKNVAKISLLDFLRTTATDVNRQANGDLLKLQSSGFKITKTPAKKGIMPKPTGFKVKTGDNSGEILFQMDAYTEADMYYFYSAAVPAPVDMTDWRLTPSTTRKKNISGYTPDKQYELRCAYKGTEDAMVYSDALLLFAQ